MSISAAMGALPYGPTLTSVAENAYHVRFDTQSNELEMTGTPQSADHATRLQPYTEQYD